MHLFFILTKPVDDDDSAPQVLCRSVVGKQYLCEDAPAIDNLKVSTPLTFYWFDGITPLRDSSLFEVSEGDDQMTDIIATGSPGDLQSLLFALNPRGHEAQDALEDSIFEVYYSPHVRPVMFSCLNPWTNPRPYHSNCVLIQERCCRSFRRLLMLITFLLRPAILLS